MVDEAHRMKNEESILSLLVRNLNVTAKLLLTGTPLQNNMHELWSLLNFLMPEIFKSSQIFDEIFLTKTAAMEQNISEEDMQEQNLKVVNVLHAILRPYMLIRKKAEVQKDIPNKLETFLYVKLTALQIDMYKQILVDRKVSTSIDARNYNNVLIQLRKICAHPYLFEGAEPANMSEYGEHIVFNCGKMTVLDKLLRKLHMR